MQNNETKKKGYVQKVVVYSINLYSKGKVDVIYEKLKKVDFLVGFKYFFFRERNRRTQ